MSETQYVCVAPAIDVVVGADANGEGGALQRIHQGGGLPLRGLYAVQIDHLVERGLIAKTEVVGGLESAMVDAALAGTSEAKRARAKAERERKAAAEREAAEREAAEKAEAERLQAEKEAAEKAKANQRGGS